MKGGTSLSKGFKIIERFSEDIDIHITTPENLKVNENPKNTKPANILARKGFYDWLAKNIKLDGIVSVERDEVFDDTDYYRSGGIRLKYKNLFDKVESIKEGILLEAGFDTVTPNQKVTISSWAYDKAIQTPGIVIIDNKAIDIVCYNQEYTFVEKLQTIATKFRKEQSGGEGRPNFMRQYYDVYCLLEDNTVQKFIGTPEYIEHKKKRFPAADLETPIAKNEAFLLNDPAIKADFIKRYKETATLYNNGQPDFDVLLERIKANIDRL
ncbi:MAG TPA: nucleotidyl transferase AbiEii/AbiGii toxin family protein [Chitinophagaceae bacterium]|nr:nucleotidyl transferase AbiEii/AbiGii toxin family protein [Chitinophagaceae bacterium]